MTATYTNNKNTKYTEPFIKTRQRYEAVAEIQRLNHSALEPTVEEEGDDKLSNKSYNTVEYRQDRISTFSLADAAMAGLHSAGLPKSPTKLGLPKSYTDYE